MNFALILFLLLMVTFAAWLAERVVFRPRRERAAVAELNVFDRDAAPTLRAAGGDQAVLSERKALRERLERQPLWLE